MTEKPTIPEVLPFVWAYYAKPGNGVGGVLHIVLDDGNVSDSCVDFCIETAIERGDVDGERLARVIRQMSRTQRKKMGHLIPFAVRA